MFLPYDKLFNNVELPKAIIQSQGLNVYEAIFSDNLHPFCVIEFLVNDQEIYLKMSSSVQRYNKFECPYMLKIYYWSYEFILTGNEKIYKFYFVTDHFDKDVRSWLNERSSIKLYLFERDLYKISRDLAYVLQNIITSNVAINPLKRETLVVSNNKIKFLPHIFLLEIAEEMSRIKLLSQKSRVEESKKTNFFENDLNILKNISSSTEEITKILDQTNASKFGSPSPSQKGSSSPKKSAFKKNEGSSGNTINLTQSPSISPKMANPKKSSCSPSKSKKLIDFSGKVEEKLIVAKKMKDCNIDPRERIYSFGIIIAMIASLYDFNDEDPAKILTTSSIKEMEKRYGKEFVVLVKKTISKENILNMNEIIDEISYLIKIKGVEDGGLLIDKKNKNLNSIVKMNIPFDRQVKFLHCFPELYQKMLFINLQDKMHIFFEIQDLNIDFIIPVDHRTIAIQKADQSFIFILGGKNTNNVYKYNSEKKILELKENMIASLERRSFGICNIRNIIYVVGGYLDNEITKSCECYDINNNYWCKIKHLNEACTDLSLCSFNEKFLYKFGGQLVSLTLCQVIEKYDISKDKWYIIQYDISQALKESFALLRNSLVSQISDEDILIIGGINIYYEGSNRCFLLKIKEIEEIMVKDSQNILTYMKEKKKDCEYSHEICSLNMTVLPSKDPLDLCMPVIVDNELFVLQFKKNNHRKLISLGKEWKEAKDIKW